MKKTIKIGNKEIGNGASTFIVAEAGLNHNGDLELAKELVRKVAEVGGDAVKFQTFITEDFINKSDPLFKLFKKLELPLSEFQELAELAKDLDILFISTPFDTKSVDFLDKLDVPAFKVASGDLTNHPFLDYIARKGKPLILSTGMSTLGEVEEAMDVINSSGNNKTVLMHCVSTYPAAIEQTNLLVMDTLKHAFQVPVGFSDHTAGLIAPLAAVVLGAQILEKHFTVSKTLTGPDHRFSLEPSEFSLMVRNVRKVEEALGSPRKEPTKEEIEIRQVARRSLFARVNIAAGTKITENLLSIKRPATGISPKHMYLVLGRTTKVGINCDDAITWNKIA